MKKTTIITQLKKMNVKYSISSHNGLLTIVDYFNKLSEIKKTLFNNSDMAIISRRNDGLFTLNIILN